ncbi:MAG: DnaK suppressor protein [Bradymonadia bacterium]|jgi:DnaK suppressor protein
MSRLPAKTLDALRARLGELRVELNELLDATKSGVKPVALDQPIGRLSRIDAIQQQKLAQANRRRTEIKLQQVMAALRSFDAGTYGVCRRCEDTIAADRLRARPETPVCMDCQQELEAR